MTHNYICAGVIALLFGCASTAPTVAKTAQAAVPAPPAPVVLAAAATPARPLAPAIADDEPAVTAEVADTLGRLGGATAPRERFTDRGAAVLDDQDLSSRLRNCDKPVKLELLSRKVKGEDRQYVYRVACRPEPVQVEVDYNKAARINRMQLSASQ